VISLQAVTVALFIVCISIIFSISVISGHNVFGSEYDTTLMTWKGIAADQRIFYSVYDYATNSWTPVTPIEGANTNLSPSLVSLPNGALLVWKGVEGDQRIFYSVYDYATNSWTPVTPIEGANTNRITSLSYLPGNNVLMTWKGVEGDQRIFYSVYDYATNSWTPVTPIEGANTSTDPSTTDTVRVTTTTPPTTPSPTTSCPNPPSGLVSWWPGDGSADDVLGNNDGVLQNGASFGSGIAGGQAFRFHGVDDYVETPSMNIGNTFSIDFWIYPEQSVGHEHLISNSFGSDSNFGALYLNFGTVEYWQNSLALFLGPQNIQPNTWSHITLTYDGSQTRIYVNGVEIQSRPTSNPQQHPETFNNALRFGSSIPHEEFYFKGLIDDVGLYNRALSASEIQTLSDGGKCSPTATATTTSEEAVEEEVPLLSEQQQQQDDEPDAEEEQQQQQEGGET
jgi:hypothetical protein